MDARHATTALLIDDDPDSRQANQEQLEADGFSVVLVRDPNEGLAGARRTAPAAIFVHLLAGEAGNIPLIQALRSDDSCRHIRVVVLRDRPKAVLARKQLRAVPRDAW